MQAKKTCAGRASSARATQMAPAGCARKTSAFSMAAKPSAEAPEYTIPS